MWAAEYMGLGRHRNSSEKEGARIARADLFHGRLTVHEHPERDVGRARLTARGNARKLWPISEWYPTQEDGRADQEGADKSFRRCNGVLISRTHASVSGDRPHHGCRCGGTRGGASSLRRPRRGGVDAKGAVVPGARVTIVNTDTNLTRETTTDGQGAFSFVNVLAGPYDVKVALQGFREAVRSRVPVTRRPDQPRRPDAAGRRAEREHHRRNQPPSSCRRTRRTSTPS